MSDPTPFTIPNDILDAARRFDEGWPETYEQIMLARRSAELHMTHARATPVPPEIEAAAERIRQWGLAIKRGLPVPYLQSTFGPHPVPLPVISQSAKLEPVDRPPIRGGTMRIELAVNLNPRGCLFLLDAWFDDCRLLPNPVELLGDELLMHLHPEVVRVTDVNIARGDVHWDRVQHSLRNLTKRLKDM